jgi:PAS domain S-box-containing protein
MYRISFGLVGLILSLLVVARNLDFLPDPDAAAIERRRVVCESVAVECALASQRKEKPEVAATFARSLARRHPDVLSVGIRDASGRLAVDTGDHESHWTGHSDDKSTPTHMYANVPLKDGSAWARVEVAFRPLPYSGLWRYFGGALMPLLAFVGVGGFLATTFYLRTVFHRVDLAQTKVVPQRVRTTLNTLAEGVLVLDRNGVIALANESFARSVGTTADELRGKKVSDLPWHTGTVELKAEDHPWVRVLKNAAPQMGQVLGLRTGDGKTMSVNATPIFGDDGSCRGALTTFDDLTAVEKAKAAAEAASKAKGEFLANVSHEIRTPMNAIMGMTELVLEGKLTTEQRECLGIVGESAASLLGVINDLLDLSKIEAGKFDLDPVEFNLRETLDDTLQTLAFRAHNKGLELGCDVNTTVPEVMIGDPVRLRQVIVNLVGNAIKFTASGEVTLAAWVEQRDRGVAQLHFTVTDTGVGIPTDKLRAVFEPFTQADASTTRRFGGTGLGLTISAHLVGLMGGSIWAESELGYGSVFHFTATFGLPTVEVERRSASDLILTQDMRALVVEDHPTTRRTLAATLETLGLRPTAVSTSSAARDALNGAEADPFVVVLVASQLPDEDGFELADEIARTRASSVLVTIPTSHLQRDIERCRQIGAGHLRKPVRRADVRRALRQLLEPDASHTNVQADSHWLPAAVPDAPTGLRVLLVEDNPFNQKVATLKLERWGHSVRVAACGRDALAALDTEAFDVLFTDIQMPDMDGYALTAAIRQREIPTGHRLPVIAMTAHAMKGVREQCLAAGMDDYVSKPIRDEDLLSALRRTVPTSGPTSAASSASDTFDYGVQETGEFAMPAALDEEAVLARVGGNRDTLRGLVEVLYQDCNTQMAELDAALRDGDPRRVQVAAHTIKGMVAFFGAGSAVETALRLEQAGERGELTGASHTFAELARHLEALATALASYAPPPDDGWQYGRGETIPAGWV